MNPALVGREYTAAPFVIDVNHKAFFDKTVGDDGSPVYPVSLAKDLFLAVFYDPEFDADAGRMVHVGQEFSFHEPFEAGDMIHRKARIVSIEEKPAGTLAAIHQQLIRDDEPIVEMISKMLFRGETKGEKKEEPPARPDPARSDTVEVAPDLPERYAKASGDNNPIHVNPEFAKMAGFRGVILQGLCTLSLAARSLPKGLTYLTVRFSKPVYPGDVLTTSVWEDGKTTSFETRNQEGARVLTEGSCTIS